jgi:hypothetical protein
MSSCFLFVVVSPFSSGRAEIASALADQIQEVSADGKRERRMDTCRDGREWQWRVKQRTVNSGARCKEAQKSNVKTHEGSAEGRRRMHCLSCNCHGGASRISHTLQLRGPYNRKLHSLRVGLCHSNLPSVPCCHIVCKRCHCNRVKEHTHDPN